jgi:hypothetical protein
MKIHRSFSYGAFAIALGLLAGTSAFAGAIQVSFDENGNGTWQDTTSASQNGYSGTSGTLQFLYETDPTGSVGGNVLVYELPELVISGPVDVGEPGDTVGVTDTNPSDVLFFTNSNGVNDGGADANLMIFYSGDIATGDLADTGLPSFAGTLLDVADETPSGSFQWLPDSGNTFPNGNEYDGISETPEPASLSMMLIGAGILGFGAIRRKTSR